LARCSTFQSRHRHRRRAGGVAAIFRRDPAYASTAQANQSERDAYAMFTKARRKPSRRAGAVGAPASAARDTDACHGRSNGVTSRIAGGTAGADYILSPKSMRLCTAAVHQLHRRQTARQRPSDLFQPALCAHTVGQAYIAGALAYGCRHHDQTVTLRLRSVQARFNANDIRAARRRLRLSRHDGRRSRPIASITTSICGYAEQACRHQQFCAPMARASPIRAVNLAPRRQSLAVQDGVSRCRPSRLAHDL